MTINTITNVPVSLTARALAHNFAQEEETRRDEMRLNKDFFYDKQAQAITLVNEDQEPFFINLTKPIINKRATLLYSNKLIRDYDGPSASISMLEAIYADNNIDSLLLQVDLNAELTGSALITPVLDDSMPNGIRLKMYDASVVSALGKEDDPCTPDALSIIRLVDHIVDEQGTVERVVKQQMWTDGAVVTYDGNVLINSETNELGFIPFANFKGAEVYDQYFGHAPARNVRLTNESMNRLLTDVAFAIKFQAFTPISVTGMSGDTLVTLHPGRALNLPAGATAEVLGTDPKIDSVLEFIKWLETKAYETASVPMISVVGGGSATSGRELMIKWYPLVQVFQEKAERFQKYELELANVILRYIGMEPIVDVNVNYMANKDINSMQTPSDDGIIEEE